MDFTVALVGRPNVGKSTLFNRLVGKKLALVDDRPGVTRDRREGNGKIADMRFRVLDTAGLEEAFDDSLEARMRQQTEEALIEADAVFFMVDARAGVTPLDEHFAQYLRKHDTAVYLIANKCEGKMAQHSLSECYKLGLGDPIAISAEHGEGILDLYQILLPAWQDYTELAEAANSHIELVDLDSIDIDAIDFENPDSKNLDSKNLDEPEPSYNVDKTGKIINIDDNRPIQLAIVGRPNVGKSTLINALIGKDRLLTGPEAGITRDSIAIDWQWKGRDFKLIDTAGLRRRGRVVQKIEKLSAADTRRSIRFAQVVALVLDANDMLEKQDLIIANQVITEGRALVLVVNKWDSIKNKQAALEKLSDRMQLSLPQVRGIPFVTVSALRGKNLHKIMDEVLEIYKIWNSRIPTARLNEWLAQMTEIHPPPLTHGRRIKLRYMTQAKTRPPTFASFISVPEDLPASYMRYLINGLRQDFDLWGVPLRIMMRKGKNPYAPKRKR